MHLQRTEEEGVSVDIREKQHSGMLYLPGDPELQREQLQCLDRLFEYPLASGETGTMIGYHSASVSGQAV